MSVSEDKNNDTNTLLDVVQSSKALNALKDEKFDVSATAKLVKLKKWLNPYVQDWAEYNNKELARLGVQDEKNPEQYTFSGDNGKEYNKLMESYCSKEILIPDRLKLQLSDLKDLKLSLTVLEQLCGVLKDME